MEQVLTTRPKAIPLKGSTHSGPLQLQEQRTETIPRHTHSQAVSPSTALVSGAHITTTDQVHGEDEVAEEAATVAAATKTMNKHTHPKDLARHLPMGSTPRARPEKDLHTAQAQDAVMDITDHMSTMAHEALGITAEAVEDGGGEDAEAGAKDGEDEEDGGEEEDEEDGVDAPDKEDLVAREV
jgi:hypothetical protein